MSQRPVYTSFSRQPIGLVREHGSRVECIAVKPWLFLLALDAVARFWGGDTNRSATPAGSVLWFFE